MPERAQIAADAATVVVAAGTATALAGLEALDAPTAGVVSTVALVALRLLYALLPDLVAIARAWCMLQAAKIRQKMPPDKPDPNEDDVSKR